MAPRLRVLAGPCPNTLVPVTDIVNTSASHRISSELFEGDVTLDIKNFTDEHGLIRNSDYFNREDRQGITWSIQVSGRFLVPFSSDDILFGNTFDRPLHLPWGSGAALKFMQFIDPTLEHDLGSQTKPWALSPLIATMPHFAHRRIDNVIEDKEEHFLDTTSQSPSPDEYTGQLYLASNMCPSSSGSSSSVSLTGEIHPDLLSGDSGFAVDSGFDAFLEKKSRKKTLAADNMNFETASERRKYFAKAENRRMIRFGPEDLISTDFCYGFLEFSPTLALRLPGGLVFDLMRYWDGQPVRFICCERKVPGEGEGGQDEAWGRCFWDKIVTSRDGHPSSSLCPPAQSLKVHPESVSFRTQNTLADHPRSKSEAVTTAGSAGTSPGDNGSAHNLYKPYMSQPVLNLGNMIVEPFPPNFTTFRRSHDHAPDRQPQERREDSRCSHEVAEHGVSAPRRRSSPPPPLTTTTAAALPPSPSAPPPLTHVSKYISNIVEPAAPPPAPGGGAINNSTTQALTQGDANHAPFQTISEKSINAAMTVPGDGNGYDSVSLRDRAGSSGVYDDDDVPLIVLKGHTRRQSLHNDVPSSTVVAIGSPDAGILLGVAVPHSLNEEVNPDPTQSRNLGTDVAASISRLTTTTGMGNFYFIVSHLIPEMVVVAIFPTDSDRDIAKPQPQHWASTQSPMVDSQDPPTTFLPVTTSSSLPEPNPTLEPRNPPIPMTSPARPSPRLAVLPPLRSKLMHRFSFDRNGNPSSIRFSPTITSHPPLPLKLPTLPPVSDSNESVVNQDNANQRRLSRVGLRSMPALPRKGTNPGAGGHEGEDGDDDDMDDDMDGEADDHVSRSRDLGSSLSKLEPVEAMSPRSRTSIGSGTSVRTHSRTSSYATALGDMTVRGQHELLEPQKRGRLGSFLPQVDTSRIDLAFLDQPLTPRLDIKGKGKARDVMMDHTETPTERTQRREYFSPPPEGVAGMSSTASSMGKRASVYQTSSLQRHSSVSPLHTPRPGYSVLKMPLPPLADAERPGMYKHASRSMFDIHVLASNNDVPTQREGGELALNDSNSEDATHVGVKMPKTPTESRGDKKQLGRFNQGDEMPSPHILRRQRSMPSYYGPSSEPPPYPNFAPLFRRPTLPPVQPRDDEGMEKLPAYTNDVYLKAIMPRKMEFSSPGMQAKDRKWRRVICVLEGTVFRIYRCPPSLAGVSVIEGWWEGKVGVGDVSMPASSLPNATTIIRGPSMYDGARRRSRSPISRLIQKQDDGEERRSETVSIRPSPAAIMPDSKVTQRSRLGVPFLKPMRRHARSISEVPQSAVMATPPRSPRGSLNLPRTPISGGVASSYGSSCTLSAGLGSQPGLSSGFLNGTGQSPTGSEIAVVSVRSPTPLKMYGDEVPDPDPSALIRSYTLQHAESGLGLDYIKRKNVIRAKMDGEQFLLQGRDAMEVVAWIEGLQSAANIALDLDERPMPRGPLFPRRRRRRRPLA
ncbi:hypothetical protein AX17_002492 [Amanita inopinata Kibby_2008]|nr:hypothetical protein AX17_002492 [Amanita inopinata Kibby_2008]